MPRNKGKEWGKNRLSTFPHRPTNTTIISFLIIYNQGERMRMAFGITPKKQENKAQVKLFKKRRAFFSTKRNNQVK